MNRDEYNLLFHKLELNRVAFKRLMDCDEEVLKLVNTAIEQERKQEFVCSTGLCRYRKPLTDEEIKNIVREAARGSAINRDGGTSLRIVKAVEAAHGIGQEKA